MSPPLEFPYKISEMASLRRNPNRPPSLKIFSTPKPEICLPRRPCRPPRDQIVCLLKKVLRIQNRHDLTGQIGSGHLRRDIGDLVVVDHGGGIAQKETYCSRNSRHSVHRCGST